MRAALVCLAISALALPARAQTEPAPGTPPASETSDRTSAAPTTTTPHDDAVGEDVVASLGTVVGSPALAGQPDALPHHRIVWREDWPRYSFDEAILSLGLGSLLIAAELLPTATADANWRGGILFDDPVREGLRLQMADARESARVASEVLQWVLVGFPFVVDALAATGIGDNNWDTAFQMGLIGLEAYVISLVVWKITTLLARRERPVAVARAEECALDPTSPRCSELIEATSFFSNQTMNAFTGASLVCLHHTHMPIFGDEAADISTCVGALTAAAVVGLLRVMSDYEYLTDVLFGAAIGFLAGYIVPWIVHYQGGARPELRPAISAIAPAPMIGPNDTYGLMVVGVF
jgi:hypothetical protein